jgi:hypothetical protein
MSAFDEPANRLPNPSATILPETANGIPESAPCTSRPIFVLLNAGGWLGPVDGGCPGAVGSGMLREATKRYGPKKSSGPEQVWAAAISGSAHNIARSFQFFMENVYLR